MPTVDEAFDEAIKSTKKEAHARASHARQTKLIRERSRQERLTAKAKAARRVEASTGVAQVKESVRAQHQQENAQRKAQQAQLNRSIARRQQAVDIGTGAVTGTASQVGQVASGNGNLIMTTIFLMAGLIIVYQLVTKGPAVSGFLGSLGDWIRLVSTNTPVFQEVGVK